MYKKITICPHCKENLDIFKNRGSHVAWCSKNPKRDTYNKDTSHMRTPEASKKRNAGIKKAHEDGKYDGVNFNVRSGWVMSDEQKQLRREKALKSDHRRLVRSIRNYIKKDGTIVKLDSRWEEVLAKRLDELNIKWVRPLPIKWVDKKGIYHNYFPDFYIPDRNLYLDPKNPFAVVSQKEKLDCLSEQIPNLKILYTIEECRNFI